MGKNYRNYGTTYRRPRRPFEKERLDTELQLCGEYGLRNKREILRVSRVLAQLRKSARELLTRDEKDTKRIFEGGAILRRCQRLGLLSGDQVNLDSVLALKVRLCASARRSWRGRGDACSALTASPAPVPPCPPAALLPSAS